uniref:Small ribosomal subunit protein uS8 n=1 Tax=candidate division WOR-3 bacterium TaxID=2052148 RepID=A0A7C4U826_UNCW3
MQTDPISDMISKINNASSARKKTVEIPISNMKKEIVKILFEEGFIANYEFVEGVKGKIIITLKYVDGTPAITKIERVSKPSRRIYVPSDKIPIIKNGYGIAVLSTSKGIMTGEKARKENCGGEIILTVW